MRYIICLTLCFIGLSLTGCNSKQAPKNQEKTINLIIQDDLPSLDPRLVRLVRHLSFFKQTYDGLTRIGLDHKPYLSLAESVTLSEDECTYTFKLRNVVWSDNTPLTAYDFERSWKQVLSADFPCDYVQLLHVIYHPKEYQNHESETVGIQALDEKTFAVTLNHPTPYFLELITNPVFFPVHPHSLEVSCGPFILDEWKQDDSITIKRNPLYWDKDKVEASKICFLVISDSNTQFSMFEKKMVDWIGAPFGQTPTAEQLEHIDSKNIRSYPILGTFWLVFNTQKLPFNQTFIRRGFSKLIDRQIIVQHFCGGFAKEAFAISPLEKGHRSKITEEEARALKRLNWPIITLKYPNTDKGQKIAQYLQQSFKEKLGVEVELRSLEYQVFKQDIKTGNFDLAFGDWIADFSDSISFFELFEKQNDPKTGVGVNASGWCDPLFTETLIKAKTAKQTDRKELYQKMSEHLAKEVPVSPIYHYSFPAIQNPELENILISPLGSADLKYARKSSFD